MRKTTFLTGLAVTMVLTAIALGGAGKTPKAEGRQDANDSTKSQADQGKSEVSTSAPVKYFTPSEGGWSKDVETGFRKKVVLAGAEGKSLAKRAWFHLAVPKSYDPNKAYPLMIILHGGPRGGPGQIVGFFRGGLTRQGVIQAYPNALVKQLLDWNYPHSGAYLLQIVRQVAREYRIDPRRLYLVGVSMGGGGTWVQGALGKDVWAAIGPISGWYGASQSPPVKLLDDMPIYCMHGTKDRAVPASRSRYAFASLKKIGRNVTILKERPEAENLKGSAIYREIQGAGHNCFLPWKKRGAPELGRMVSWLLAQKRDKPADLDKALKLISAHGKRFGWTPKGSPVGSYPSAKKGNEDEK
jgi:predicted esterase